MSSDGNDLHKIIGTLKDYATHLLLIFKKIISPISLSNWNLGHCAPQEDGNLYNRDAV